MLYVTALLDLLADQDVEVDAIISDSGKKVLRLEQDMAPDDLPGVSRWFASGDFTAPPASGSARYDAMIILPCTVGTLGAIAAGFSGNLIHRAADVTLKERRPLILAVRETPLNRTHLNNMLTLHDAGATICPPMPSFYQSQCSSCGSCGCRQPASCSHGGGSCGRRCWYQVGQGTLPFLRYRL